MSTQPQSPSEQTPAQSPPAADAGQPAPPPVQPPVEPPEPQGDPSSMDLFTEAAARAQQAQPQDAHGGAADSPSSVPTGQVEGTPATAGSSPGESATAPQPGGEQPTLSEQEAAYLQSIGVDPQDQQQAISGLLSRIREMTPYAQAGMKQFSQPQQPTQTEPPQQQESEPEQFNAEKYFSEKWQVPEYLPAYDNAIQKGIVVPDEQTGLYRPAPGYEQMAAPVLQGLNEYHQRRAEMMQDLFAGNPFQKFHEVLQEPIKQSLMGEVETLVQQQLKQIEDRRFFEDFRAQNQDWIYAEQNGQQVETPAGKAFLDQCDKLVERGFSEREAFEFAQQNRQAFLAQGGNQQAPPAPAQQPPPPTGAAQAAATQQAAVAQPQAHPSQPVPPAQPVQQEPSFLDSAMSRVAHNANASGGSGAPDPLVDVDLDSMFNQAARAVNGQAPVS